LNSKTTMQSVLHKFQFWVVLGCLGIAIQVQANEPIILHKDDGSLRVMTLNIAHARAQGVSQLLQSTQQARANLLSIADVVRREAPHVIAFQEIDQGSFWNGNFSHTAFLAEQAVYPHHFSGSHVSGNSLDYGTSIMSRQGISQSRSVSFDKPFLRQPKGFVVTTIDWPSAGDVKVDVVSLHLDFLTEAKRRAEIEQLVQALASQTQSRLAKGQQPNLRILMGDFNIDYGDDDALIHELTEKLQLHTYRPMEQLITFPRFERRLDWVLVSRDLEFVEHRVLADPLSDHQAVVADLVMKNPPVPALVSSVELGD
jgi:endonuclease/exonuclease/phosphatase family metal-dependent hydrolase